MYKNFESLLQSKTFDSENKKTLVVAAAHDKKTILALKDASNQFEIGFILVGDQEKIISISNEIDFKIEESAIINANSEEECAEISVSLIKNGKGDFLMKGLVNTTTLLKAVLDKEKGIRGRGFLSHITVLEVPTYHKLLFLTDGGMNPHPDLSQKKKILENAIEFMKKIGINNPKVAALSSSETVSHKIQETVDAKDLENANKSGEIKDCILEGPLSLDLAISKESAEIKNFQSQIAGDVDLLLFPDVSSANIFSKGLIYLAHGKMAGCIIGADVPIVLVSRGSSEEEKRLSILTSNF